MFGIILLRGQIPHFAIHLFAGMVVVNLFTESFNSGTRSIMQNKSMVQKMPLPREIFPIASMLVSLYHTGPQLVILIGACLVTGSFSPDPVGILAALMAFAIVILLGTGMGLMFAAINVMYRDWTRVVQIFTNMLPFSVPMMYPYTLVHERFDELPDHRAPLPAQPDHRGGAADAAVRSGSPRSAPRTQQKAKEEWGFSAGPGRELPAAPVPARPDHARRSRSCSSSFAQWVFSRLDDKIPDRLV